MGRTELLKIALLLACLIFVNLVGFSNFKKVFHAAETAGRDESPGGLKMTDQTIETDWEGQIITIKEDGGFGNLLLEVATLIIIGKRCRRPVQILPQVGRKIERFFSRLPVPAVDYKKVSDLNCFCHHLIPSFFSP